MTYREAGLAPPCHRCDRPSQAACPCCRRPTCARHLGTGEMCTHCDEGLYRYLRTEQRSGWSMLAALGLVLGPVALAVVAAFTVPVLAPVAIVGSMLALPLHVVLRKRRRRARFVRLVRARGELPPADGDDESPEEQRLAAYLRAREARRLDATAAAPTSDPPAS